MKKYKWLCAALLAAGIFLTGCSAGTSPQQSKESTEETKPQIGISFDSFVIERWLRDRDVFVSTAENLGAEVNVQNANGDVQEQIEQIEYFIEKKVDVIAIIAVDGEQLTEVVKKARSQGIKVVCYDRLITDVESDLYISFDNERVGELMAQALQECCPQGGSIYAINGSPTDHNVEMVVEGFTKGLEGSNLNVVYTGYCENWLAEMASDHVETAIAQYPDVVGIMCGNDDLASQAIKVLSENRLAGKVAVVAQDAELAACQRIVEGTQEMTVYKSVEVQAKAAAEFSVALAKGINITSGESPQQVTETITTGEFEIPYYSIEPVAVTAENLEEVIIEGGFHTAEDVYLNVNAGGQTPDNPEDETGE